MEKQVGKSDVFTKESLIRLQDKMRTLCIEEFNHVYSLDSTLKQKQKGRNRDIHVSDMDNYIEMKKQIENNTENLKQANKKSSVLKENSKDIKDKIDKFICTGPQKYDLATRLKYAGFDEKKIICFDNLYKAEKIIKRSSGSIYAILNFDYLDFFNDIMKEEK